MMVLIRVVCVLGLLLGAERAMAAEGQLPLKALELVGQLKRGEIPPEKVAKGCEKITQIMSYRGMNIHRHECRQISSDWNVWGGDNCDTVLDSALRLYGVQIRQLYREQCHRELK